MIQAHNALLRELEASEAGRAGVPHLMEAFLLMESKLNEYKGYAGIKLSVIDAIIGVPERNQHREDGITYNTPEDQKSACIAHLRQVQAVCGENARELLQQMHRHWMGTLREYYSLAQRRGLV
jgi:hypothetical protein